MNERRWIEQLSDEDINLIKRFMLASGSLKEMATLYGVSYPTIRLRLDRLIEKIKVIDSQDNLSEFELTLRGLYAEGKIDLTTFNALRTAHQHDIDTDDKEST